MHIQSRIYTILCMVVQLFAVSGQTGGFGKDGTIPQVVFAQNAVEKNVDEASLIAIRYKRCSVIVDITRRVPQSALLLDAPDQYCISYRSKFLTALFVGNRADSQKANSLCSELDTTSRLNNGVSLTAPQLSLKLADYAQDKSMELSVERLLAVNALIIDTDDSGVGSSSSRNDKSNMSNNKKKHNNIINPSYGDIYKVDVSGNFFRCRAVCVGARAGRVNAWLDTRGRYLAGQQLTKRKMRMQAGVVDKDNECDSGEVNNTAINRTDIVEGVVTAAGAAHNITTSTSPDSTRNNTISSTDTTTSAPNNDTFTSSLEACMNITMSCLAENFPNEALCAGNYSVSIRVVGDDEDEEEVYGVASWGRHQQG